MEVVMQKKSNTKSNWEELEKQSLKNKKFNKIEAYLLKFFKYADNLNKGLEKEVF